jgi:hypothetical protein
MTEQVNEEATASSETKQALDEMKQLGIIEGEQEAPAVESTPEESPVEETPEVEEETEETEEVEVKRQPTRTAKFVPVNKYNELRHSLNDLKSEITDWKSKYETLASKSPVEQEKKLDDISSKLSDKHGLDKDLIKDLVSEMTQVLGEKTKLPQDVEYKLQLLEKNTQLQNQIKEFENEYSGVAKELNLSASDKEAIQKLAFTQGFETTPIRTLAIQYLYENPKRTTVEGEAKGRSAKRIIDLDNLSEEDLAKMNPNSPEFEQFVSRVKAKSGWTRA